MNLDNMTILEGFINNDIKLENQNGTSLLNVRLLVTESYKNSKGEFKRRKLELPVVFWSSGAETVAKRYRRGSQLKVQGKLDVDDQGVYVKAELFSPPVRKPNYNPQNNEEVSEEQEQEEAKS